MNPDQGADRRELEALISADARALSAESDQIGRLFAAAHQVHATDFRALLYILVAESGGTPLTSGELRQKLGLSGSAITYLVERMIGSGHIWRDSDSADRRKVILRYADHGRDTAVAFFTPLAAHTHATMADVSDTELVSAHRVLTALLDAMRRFQDELTSSAMSPPSA
ncbi:MarR family transcriptional regulator [Mycobacterium kyorinense]|uniref:MarR family transcriptional regulator n=1 Tax=Mycobacterium kyorinense TaxID=487514 RepID=A0A1A2ZFK9_9MYCO|nr:MarR family winged helix-turn-helix transcriptional regulator [Mycobacterium kyorinense]OBI48287.1 MarR family transcriptional regulator [Mycobacterium kyorinense]